GVLDHQPGRRRRGGSQDRDRRVGPAPGLGCAGQQRPGRSHPDPPELPRLRDRRQDRPALRAPELPARRDAGAGTRPPRRHLGRANAMSNVVDKVWATLEPLTAPEIPVVTLRELGILREVRETPAGIEVVITPTYSGCPAMGQIEDDVRSSLAQAGIEARVITQLAPAWTTDWMSDEAKEKLRAYGIAPPHQTRQDVSVVKFMRRPVTEAVACPQ